MGGYFKRRLVDPFVMPIIIIGILAAIIITIGETLLALFEPGEVDRIDRPELLFAIGLSIAVLFGFAFLYTRPKNTLGPIDRDIAIGNPRRGIFDDPLPPLNALARTGPRGAVSDIEEGYTLYAGSGALAVVRGVLPGARDHGRQFSGFLYANGLSGASDELWIPVEAVMSVYPETKSAFLAIKGDETEHFGWHVPPASMVRTPPRPSTHV